MEQDDRPVGPKHNQFSDAEEGVFLFAYMDQIKANIRDYGWAVQGVFPAREGEGELYFAYTVGLMDKGAVVELLIAGLPLSFSATLLNAIARATLDNNGIPPKEWKLDTGVKLKCVLHVFDRSDELQLGVARLYYGLERIPVAQYVWPTNEGLYPWDEGWSSAALQPVGGPVPGA